MEALKTGSDTLFILLGRDHGAGDARGFRVPRARHGAPEEPGQCAGEDPGRLRGVDRRVLLHRLRDRLRRHRSSPARDVAGGEERLRAGASSSSCSRSRRRFPRSCPAASPSARSSTRSSPRRSCWSGSSIRSSKASPGTSTTACRRWLKARLRRGVPRLRRQRRRARDGRLDRRSRRCCCSARGAAAIRKDGRHRARIRRRRSRSSRWAPGCCRVGWFGFNVMSRADASTRSRASSRSTR